ncbi:MAG: ROK family protein [Crocinitomicaceae bacterium]|nr:ROK family protein [Crocinitomicaceae bacterium]
MTKNLALGVDIGGTNTVFGAVDTAGTIHFEYSIPTPLYTTAEELVDEIYNKVKATGKLEHIIGIGIGAPNGNFFSGTIEFAPNLNWKGIIPLTQLFKNRFKCSTTLTNDANAAAIGELTYGAAKGLSDFVIITLGTGLGSGVVIDNNLVYGHDGFAGEYGHIRVINNGRLCGCGRRGCLETYASATGVVRSITELESKYKATSKLNNITNPSASDVFKLSEEGDLFCNEIVEYTAKVLGSSLADFSSFNSPKAYILFGGIAQSGKPFADKVKKYMEESLLKIYQNKIEIRISQLHDKNAAVLGSASLVWNQHN